MLQDEVSVTSPFVSIVIPCFNAEADIGEAVESALSQSYRNREVIVIDDGSTDDSVNKVRAFGDTVRLETGPNRGACAARNRGIEIARGDLIQFLDADDLLDENKLEVQVPLLAADRLSLTYCNWRYVVEGEGAQVIRRDLAPGADPVPMLLRANVQTSAPLHWRENLLSCGGFREELPCAQERDLHLRLACSGIRFHHLDQDLYTVRRRRQSISSNWLRNVDQHRSSAVIARGLLEERGELTESRSAALAAFLAADAKEYLKHGAFEKAQEYFAEALRMHSSGGIPDVWRGAPRQLQRFVGARVTQRLIEWRWRWRLAFSRRRDASV